MAVMKIAHKPDLTKEQAQRAFTRHFEGKYAVKPCDGLCRSRPNTGTSRL